MEIPNIFAYLMYDIKITISVHLCIYIILVYRLY